MLFARERKWRPRMRGTLRCIAVVVVSVLFVPRQIPAHHAFASEFNPNKVLMINGTISDVSWTNPHVAVRIAVKDPSGRAELWTVRGDSPSVLERNGWSRRALVVGQQLVACGYESKSGQHEMSGEQVALASGVRMPFATTDLKSCQRVDLRPGSDRQTSAAGQRSNNPNGLITNPVGAMGNPIGPMGNPIAPAGNPIGPVVK
jgi:hypothetical protein